MDVPERNARSLFIDLPMGDDNGPRRGDIIQAVGKLKLGARYQVMISRRVKRKDPNAPPRFTMVVKTVAGDFIPKRSYREFDFRWYPREKRKVKWRGL